MILDSSMIHIPKNLCYLRNTSNQNFKKKKTKKNEKKNKEISRKKIVRKKREYTKNFLGKRMNKLPVDIDDQLLHV